MTSYSTCINCAADKQTCDRRKEIRAAIKGAHITSLKFKCADRKSMFRPGQRVEVTWTVVDDVYETDETWSGTVLRESEARFLIAIDDAPSDEGTPARDFIRNERLFVKVSPSRLNALDEPDRRICNFCERAPADGDPCNDRDGNVWSFNAGYPMGCLIKDKVDAA